MHFFLNTACGSAGDSLRPSSITISTPMRHLKRSGGALSLLLGHFNIRVLPQVSSERLAYVRSSWVDPAQHTRMRQAVTIARQHRMISTHEGSDACHQNMGSGSNPCTIPRATLELHVESPQDMEKIGAFFGEDSRSGDVVLLAGKIWASKVLYGGSAVDFSVAFREPGNPTANVTERDLGTGKTCFARGFIRARVDANIAVTSPTYLLDNTYKVQDQDLTIHHMDLYRLCDSRDLGVVDIPRVLETSICLIEWPDRLGATKPRNRLDVEMTAVNEGERTVTLIGHGAWWAAAVDDFREVRQ